MDNKKETVISFKNVEVNFRIRQSFFKEYIKREKKIVHALDNVSFDIARGEVLSLVGESGSGKTTTGRSLLRLVHTTSGDIFF